MSVSSAKGRKLPPLLPVEYCRLDRAARMLECEVEDLLHWGVTSAIRLHYFASRLPCYSLLTLKNSDQKFSASNEDEREFKWKITSHHVLEIQKEIQNKANQGALYGRLSGFFEVFEGNLLNLYLRRVRNDFFALILDEPEIKDFLLFWVHSEIDPDLIFIKKCELEKVYQAITTGHTLSQNKAKTPPLEIMQRISETKAAAERNSAPRAELVLSLLELVLGEESSLIDNPYALYQRVNKQLREAKIIEPEITEQAFADILSKAKSARKDRLENPS